MSGRAKRAGAETMMLGCLKWRMRKGSKIFAQHTSWRHSGSCEAAIRNPDQYANTSGFRVREQKLAPRNDEDSAMTLNPSSPDLIQRSIDDVRQ
jgi:hypothetical protein